MASAGWRTAAHTGPLAEVGQDLAVAVASAAVVPVAAFASANELVAVSPAASANELVAVAVVAAEEIASAETIQNSAAESLEAVAAVRVRGYGLRGSLDSQLVRAATVVAAAALQSWRILVVVVLAVAAPVVVAAALQSWRIFAV